MKDIYNILLQKKYRDLLIVLEDKNLENYLFEIFSMGFGNVGIISKKVPFLSNLEMIENIFLPLMYRENISLQNCYIKFKFFIEILGLEDVLWLRKERLTDEELLKCMLLRALCVESEIIFLEYPVRKDFDLIRKILESLKIKYYLWVVITTDNLSSFKDIDFERFFL
ncbi:MAG: hypothetical protein Q9M37_00195 [Desulfonauticus sp.]|nr:hypothetical protein [Desulfonauticus sp.]